MNGKPEVTRFVEEMLSRLRKQFYPAPRWGEKRFYQERQRLIEAITWPARWMNERGVVARPSMYRRILDAVIATIRDKGNVAQIRCFSVYFLYAVQEHMNHHGDQYYYTAKAARSISDVLPAVTRPVRPGRAPDSVTRTLAQLNQVLRSRGGRRRRDSVDQPDLLPTSKARKSRQAHHGKIRICSSNTADLG